jgi:hypothetical protein
MDSYHDESFTCLPVDTNSPPIEALTMSADQQDQRILMTLQAERQMFRAVFDIFWAKATLQTCSHADRGALTHDLIRQWMAEMHDLAVARALSTESAAHEKDTEDRKMKRMEAT